LRYLRVKRSGRTLICQRIFRPLYPDGSGDGTSECAYSFVPNKRQSPYNQIVLYILFYYLMISLSRSATGHTVCHITGLDTPRILAPLSGIAIGRQTSCHISSGRNEGVMRDPHIVFAELPGDAEGIFYTTPLWYR